MSVKRQQVVSDATRKLLGMFESGEMPASIALSIIQRKEGHCQPSLSWSLGNRLLLLAQGSTDGRGIRQWEAVGRRIKRGAKALYIFAPTFKKVLQDEESGIETTKTVFVGFKAVPVFRVEDTFGKELTQPDYAPAELPPFWEVAKYLGINVNYEPCGGNYFGFFSPPRQEIIICSHDPLVFFHELAHAVHHHLKVLEPGPDPEKEVIAEVAAVVLAHLQGIEGFECQSYEYIQAYASKMPEQDTLKVLMQLLSTIEEIVLRIIEIAELIEGSKMLENA